MSNISVVIPTYNRAELIGETITAVMRQTLPPAEIIVVDDGSTDITPATLAAYGDDIKVIRIKNSGELVARNTGLRAASSELVAFCDSDDVWDPDYLDIMSSLWKDEPGLHAAYANFRVFSNGESSTKSKFEDAPSEFWNAMRLLSNDRGVFEGSYVEELICFQPFFPSTMTVKRKTFLEFGGWDERVSRSVGCDFATALRMAANPPVGVVRRPLVSIRKHSGNFSGNTERMNLGDAAVLEHVLASNPAMKPMRDKFEASMAKRREAALHAAFDRRDFAAVRTIFSMLPSNFSSSRTRVKRIISSFPSPLAVVAASILSR